MRDKDPSAWIVEHAADCRVHDHTFRDQARAADCSCGASVRWLLGLLAQRDDFLVGAGQWQAFTDWLPRANKR